MLEFFFQLGGMGKGKSGEDKLGVVFSWQDPVAQVLLGLHQLVLFWLTLANFRSCSYVVYITGLPHTLKLRSYRVVGPGLEMASVGRNSIKRSFKLHCVTTIQSSLRIIVQLNCTCFTLFFLFYWASPGFWQGYRNSVSQKLRSVRDRVQHRELHALLFKNSVWVP